MCTLKYQLSFHGIHASNATFSVARIPAYLVTYQNVMDSFANLISQAVGQRLFGSPPPSPRHPLPPKGRKGPGRGWEGGREEGGGRARIYGKVEHGYNGI